MADSVSVRRVFNFICSSGGFVELSVLLRHDSPLGNNKTESEVRKWLSTYLCRADCPFVAVTDCEGEMAGARINFRMKLCHEYCDKGSCEKERGKCKFWHICKGFLEGSCFGKCCRSHNFYDKDNKAKAKVLGVEIFSNGTVRNAVAWSLPQVCQLYLRNECRSDNCPYLHVCSQAVKGPACDWHDCILSHTLTDHHNNKVLQQYDMVPHDPMKLGFLCCNILVQKEQRIFHNRRCTCGGQATNEGLSQLGDSATTELPSEKGLTSPKHIAVDDLYDQGTHAISNVTNSEQKELEGAFKLQMESENKVRNPCKSKLLLNKRTKATSEGLSDTSSPQPNTNSLERLKLIGSEGSDSCSNSSSNVQQECKARKESKNVKKCGRDSRTHHPPRKNSLHVDDRHVDDRHAVRQQESKKSVSTCELNLKRKDEDEVKVLGFNKTSTSSKHHSLEEPKVAKRNPRTSKTTTKCLKRADKGDGPRGGELNRGIKVCNELAPRNRKCLQKSGQEKCTMTREGCGCAIKDQVEKVQKDANSAHSPDKPNTKVSLPNDSKRGINGSKITTQIHDTAATDCIEEQKQDLVSAKANSDSKPLYAHLTSESVLQRNGPKRRSKDSKMTAQSLDTQTVSKSAKVNNEPNPLSAHLTNESDTKVLPGNDPKRRSKGSKMTAQSLDTQTVSKSAKVNNEPNPLSAHLTNESDTKVLPGNDPKRKSKGSKMTAQIPDTESVSKSAKVNNEPNLLNAHLTNESDTKVLSGKDPKRKSKGSKMTAQIPDTESVSKSAKVNNEPNLLNAHLTNESDTKVLSGKDPKRKSKGSKMTAQSLDTQTVSKGAKVNNGPNLLNAHLTNESDTRVLPGNDPERKSKGSKVTAQSLDTQTVSKSANVNNEPNLLNAHLTNESDSKVLPGNDPKRKSKGSKMTAKSLDTQTVSKSAKVNNEPNLSSAHLTNESDSKVLPGNGPKRKSKGSKMTAQNLDTESVSKSANVNNGPNLLNAHLTNESDTRVLPGNDPKRKSKGSKMTAQSLDTQTVSKSANVNNEPNLLNAHLTNESDSKVLPGNDPKRKSKGSKMTAQSLDTQTVSKSANVNNEPNLLNAHLTNESDSKVLPGNDPKRKSKGSKMTAKSLDTQTVSKSAKVNNEPNLSSAHLTNESDSKVLPGNGPKRKSKGSKMTAQNVDTESVSKSANLNNEPNLLNAHLTNESDSKVLPGNDPKRRPKSAKATAEILDTATAKLAEEQKKETKIAKAKPNHRQDENASKNSAQGSNRTKESARSAYKLGQTNNTSLGRNDSKRRKQSSKMITQISHTTAVRNVEELKQDLESANYKENHESKPNHLQDETAAKKSVQETKMTKENLDRSARKQKFDNEIENFPCNSLSESAQKRLEISCDTSANNTPAKHNKTMKITEYLAPDGLMQDLAITEGANTLVTDNSRDLQSLLPSKSMEAESYRELFDSNSCRPASLTRDVSLKMKVFECLCKEYDCSASFTVISKRRDLFPCGFKDIKSWFKKHGKGFLITADKQGVILEVNAYSSWARLCCNYNRVGECRRQNCQYLHICKDYVTNSCSHGTFCPWNHHFQDERDKALLSRVGLDKLTDEQLRKLVLSSSPQVCVAYNKDICDQGNSCKRIHICCDHLKMTCRKECRYGLDHESAMNTGHTQSVLKRYHLDHLHSHLLKQIILVSDQSPKASKKDVPICSDFLLGICGKGFHCQAYHCPLPFYWQYRLTKDNEWKSFGEEDNEKLEKLYCDVTQNDCSATGFHISLERGESILLKEAHEVRFLLDRMVMVLEEESEIIADLRRLSTPSNVTDPGSSVAVHWIWYWKERDEIWREYGQDDRGRDLQRALEEAFLNSRNCFRFRLVGQEYTLSFAPTVQMSETSLKLGSVRTVRRRPARVISKNDIPNLERSHILLPLSWRNKTRRVKMPRNRTAVPSDREFKRISLPPHSAEFREMAKVFSKSIKCSVVIINIEKVQVPFMWKKYQRRKGFKPGVKAGGSKRKLLTERQLAHGIRTAEKKSWKQNLDWCSACKYVCTFSREEHQRVRRRKLLRLDFLPQE